VLAGEEKIELDERTTIDVRLKIKHLSFSAHADAMGILQLIRQCQPENIMLVHGEAGKMYVLKSNLHSLRHN
jgi:integrator complex subunit 11